MAISRDKHVGFIGLGIAKRGLWQSWTTTSILDGARETECRLAIADARMIALSHVSTHRPGLSKPWDGLEQQDRMTAAVLGAAVAEAAIQSERRVLTRAIGALRVLLRSDFFWIEASPRAKTYDVGFHQLPVGVEMARDAFMVFQRQHQSMRVAAE